MFLASWFLVESFRGANELNLFIKDFDLDSDSDYESENKIHTRHIIIIRRLIYIYIKTELMRAVLVFPPLPVCDLLITL